MAFRSGNVRMSEPQTIARCSRGPALSASGTQLHWQLEMILCRLFLGLFPSRVVRITENGTIMDVAHRNEVTSCMGAVPLSAGQLCYAVSRPRLRFGSRDLGCKHQVRDVRGHANCRLVCRVSKFANIHFAAAFRHLVGGF